MTFKVALKDLLDVSASEEAKKQAVDLCVKAMQSQGWILVDLPRELRPSSSLEKTLLEFFQNEEKDRNSNPYWRSSINQMVGLNYDKGRLSMRTLTGTELVSLENAKQYRSHDLNDRVRYSAEVIDDALIGVTNSLAPHFFESSVSDVAYQLDLPLLIPEIIPEPTKKKIIEKKSESARFGLLEVAYYNCNNRDKSRSSAEAVVSHVDPGLFSLNVLSSQLGLQFQDADGLWIDIAPDESCGVLWAGQAAHDASNGRIKAAIHRVLDLDTMWSKKQPVPPRLSMWSEICTRNQVLVKDRLDSSFQGNKIKLQTRFGDEYIVSAKEGEVMKALRLVQQLDGLPMSKVIRTPIFNNEGEVTGIR